MNAPKVLQYHGQRYVLAADNRQNKLAMKWQGTVTMDPCSYPDHAPYLARRGFEPDHSEDEWQVIANHVMYKFTGKGGQQHATNFWTAAKKSS